MKPDITEPGPLWRRISWFVGIWAASVGALGIVALILRRVING
ncbi:MAG: DUF2474 domain-containing protein [Pseudomonadota bacterium]